MNAGDSAEERKRKRAVASNKGRYANKCAVKHLKKTLSSPARVAQEQAFAQAHADETDEELYSYVKELKRRMGRHMKPSNTIGYRYLVKRLGEWNTIMGRVNPELREERPTKNIKMNGSDGDSGCTSGSSGRCQRPG